MALRGHGFARSRRSTEFTRLGRGLPATEPAGASECFGTRVRSELGVPSTPLFDCPTINNLAYASGTQRSASRSRFPTPVPTCLLSLWPPRPVYFVMFLCYNLKCPFNLQNGGVIVCAVLNNVVCRCASRTLGLSSSIDNSCGVVACVMDFPLIPHTKPIPTAGCRCGIYHRTPWEPEPFRGEQRLVAAPTHAGQPTDRRADWAQSMICDGSGVGPAADGMAIRPRG
jgi:hypothetical protein